MEIVKNTPNDNLTPDEVMKAIEGVKSWKEQINKRESDSLMRVFTRFCLLRGLMVDVSSIRRKTFEDRPNYCQYWFMSGQPGQILLMERELIIDNNEPKLNISFPKWLIDEK